MCNGVGVKRTPRVFLDLVYSRKNALERLNLEPGGPRGESSVLCCDCLNELVEIWLSCRFNVHAPSSSVVPKLLWKALGAADCTEEKPIIIGDLVEDDFDLGASPREQTGIDALAATSFLHRLYAISQGLTDATFDLAPRFIGAARRTQECAE